MREKEREGREGTQVETVDKEKVSGVIFRTALEILCKLTPIFTPVEIEQRHPKLISCGHLSQNE